MEKEVMEKVSFDKLVNLGKGNDNETSIKLFLE